MRRLCSVTFGRRAGSTPSALMAAGFLVSYFAWLLALLV
jgi:hypothetical protein